MKRLILIFLAVLAAGCSRGGGDSAADDNAADQPIAEVHVAVAAVGTNGSTITAYGVTEAGPGATRSLVAPAEAIIDSIYAPTGTTVGAGQAIVSLRPSRASRLESAKAFSDAQAANASYARALRLKRDGLASNADVETARAAATAARAAVANIGIGSGITLRAPQAGTVQGLISKPGDQVAAGASVATIAGRGDVRARFGVDPAAIPRIRAGSPAQIQLAAGGQPVSAPVAGVDPTVDSTTHLGSVFVRIPAVFGAAVGVPLRADFETGATQAAISVPYSALLDDGGRSYIFVVRKGVAKRVDVTPGNSSGNTVEILKGLQPGDEVVTEGGTALEDGMKVHVAGARR